MTFSNNPHKPTNMQRVPTIIALCVLVLLVFFASIIAGQKQALAVLIGALAGFSLYHASFGFTAGWRRVVTEARGSGLRHQFLLILIVSAVSYPLLAYGNLIELPASIFGDGATLRTNGFVAPVGVGMLFGALLFGFGMQYGGGCGSGTLFVAGGGSTRMVITLFFFVIGSYFGSIHLHWWNDLPRFAAWSMVRNLGPFTAYIILLSALLLIGWYTILREKKWHGSLEATRETGSLIKGPWSPMAGVMGLAAVCILTLLILGRPWGITSAFALWGAKGANALGVDVYQYPYWMNARGAVEGSVFKSTTSVMNFGIIAGAMAAAALASKWRPVFKLTRVEVSTAIIGGLFMGYGARLAYGCNIGAYLGGLVSGSLHGWAWAFMAFIGSMLAIYSKKKLRI